MKVYLVLTFLTISVLLPERSFSQDGPVRISFTTSSYLEFIVANPIGQRTGRDPRGQDIKYHEIPTASYIYDGYGDGQNLTTFAYTMISPQEDGIYGVKIIGRENTKYDFEFRAIPHQSAQLFKQSIHSMIDSNAEQNYNFTYYGNPSIPAKIEKIVTISTLAQDVSAGGKLNLVGNQTFTNSLVTQCNQMAAFYNSGDKRHAHFKLNDLKALIQGAYYGPTSTVFVNQYAYDVLLEDINLTFTLIGYNGTIEDRPQKN